MLALDDDGNVVHLPHEWHLPSRTLVGVCHPSQPGLIFLTAACGPEQRISVADDQGGTFMLSYQITTDPARDAVSLRSPRNGLFICAVPAPDAPTYVNGNRREVGAWEEFRLVPFLGRMDGAWIERVAAAIDVLPSELLKPADLTDWLQRIDPNILKLVAPTILSSYDSETVTTAFTGLSEASLDAVMTVAFTEDFWFAPAFQVLAKWLQDKTVRRKLVLGPDLDPIAHRSITDTPCGVSVARKRRGVVPRHELAVVTSVHNDGPYIMEWVAHHRSLGAQGIFIYATDGDDGSEMLLDALADAGIITWIRCRNGADVPRHAKASTHYLTCLPQSLDYRWSLAIDIEEFLILNPDRNGSLVDLIRAREKGGATAVALSRLNFLSGGQKTWTFKPLLERFSTRLPALDRTVKFLFLTRNFTGAYAAEPIPSPGEECVYHTASGSLHHWPGRRFSPSVGNPEFDDAWINSYRIKSADEMMWEVSKGNCTALTPQHLLSHIQDRARDPSIDDRRAEVNLPGLHHELAALRSFPAVAAAEAAMLQTVSDRLASIRHQLRAEMEDDPILRGVAAHWLTRC